MFQIGIAQRLGGLAAQVVGGFVFDVQQRVAVAAHLIDGLARAPGVAAVLRQREVMAGHHLAGRAAAVEAHHAGFMCLQAARGGKLRAVAVGMAAVAVVVIVFKAGHRAGLDVGLRMRRVREQLAVVPGQARHGIRPYRPGRAKARDAVLGFRGVAAVKAQRGVGAGGPRRARVEHDQPVARAARGFVLLFALLVVEAEAQAGFGHQAQHEGQVGLAVLCAQRPRRGRFGDVERVGRLRIVGEDFAQDVSDRLVLVQKAVAAQAQGCQPGRGVQPVARQAAVCAQRVHAFHHCMPLAPVAVGQQQADADLAAQQGLHIQFGRGRQAIQRQGKQFRHAFAQDHPFYRQRRIQGRAHL